MKKILYLVFTLILFFSFSQSSNAIVSPTNEFYVNDYANVLSEDTKNYILENSAKLYDKTGAQIVVVTVKNMDGSAIEDYANDVFNKFGIGNKDKKNGLLILLSVEDRKSRIEVGYGLEGFLTDGKTGRVQDQYMIPYFKNNDYDLGIKNGYQAFYKLISNHYDGLPEENVSQSTNNQKGGGFIIFYVTCFMAGILVANIKRQKLGIMGVGIYDLVISIILAGGFSLIASIFDTIRVAVFCNIVGFIIGSARITGTGGYRGQGRSGGFFSSRSSSGGFHGGEGSSGGGGSSRGF